MPGEGGEAGKSSGLASQSAYQNQTSGSVRDPCLKINNIKRIKKSS